MPAVLTAPTIVVADSSAVRLYLYWTNNATGNDGPNEIDVSRSNLFTSPISIATLTAAINAVVTFPKPGWPDPLALAWAAGTNYGADSKLLAWTGASGFSPYYGGSKTFSGVTAAIEVAPYDGYVSFGLTLDSDGNHFDIWRADISFDGTTFTIDDWEWQDGDEFFGGAASPPVLTPSGSIPDPFPSGTIYIRIRATDIAVPAQGSYASTSLPNVIPLRENVKVATTFAGGILTGTLAGGGAGGGSHGGMGLGL